MERGENRTKWKRRKQRDKRHNRIIPQNKMQKKETRKIKGGKQQNEDENWKIQGKEKNNNRTG